MTFIINHLNEFGKIDLVDNEVLHNKIGFVFQKLDLYILLKFGFLRIFSSLFLLCSETFVDKKIICRPFTTGLVYLPEKNRYSGSNQTMI